MSTTRTMTTNHPDWFNDLLGRIRSHLGNAAQSFQQAAAIYVEGITRDPTFKDYVADMAPEVPSGVFRSLELVGRGQLDARIGAGGCPFGHKLRRLPMSEQKQALDGTLPLLTASGDTLQVRLDALLPTQAEQVFAAGHIRSLAEQKAWMEAKAAEFAMTKATVSGKGPNIEINRKQRCIVVNGAKLTADDLLDYLRKLQG